MPARLPRFNHQVEVRTMPVTNQEVTPAVVRHPVVLSTTSVSDAVWRSLFAAFDKAGNGSNRYVMANVPDVNTGLVVWDVPGEAPPASWRAPHWWIATNAAQGRAFPELKNASAININGVTLKYVDSPRGRLWTSDAFPPRDADTARALYEAWQSLRAAPAPAYPMPSQAFTKGLASSPGRIDAKAAAWLAYVLFALFILERILAHARRN
jgi:hypothetical protein